MLPSFNKPYDKNETDEQCRAQLVGEMMQALAEAGELLTLLYSELCEAARLLRENGIRNRVDMPEEHAEAVLDSQVSFYQMSALLDSRREELEYQIKKKAQAQEEK